MSGRVLVACKASSVELGERSDRSGSSTEMANRFGDLDGDGEYERFVGGSKRAAGGNRSGSMAVRGTGCSVVSGAQTWGGLEPAPG